MTKETFWTQPSGRVLAASMGIALAAGGGGAFLVPTGGVDATLRTVSFVIIVCITASIWACAVAAYESPQTTVSWVVGLPGALFAYFYGLGMAYEHAPVTAYLLLPVGLGAVAMAAFRKGAEPARATARRAEPRPS